MSYSLNINAFRFNSKTDFLPYYKQYKISIKKDALLIDLLNAIKEQDSGFSFSTDKALGIKVNSIGAYTSTPLKTIVETFKTDTFTLEPLSERRAVNDLEINTDDFLKKIAPLAPFMEDGDEEYYHELVIYYYLSPALEFEPEYFGDSLFLFAIFLLKKYPHKKEGILRAVADERYGVWLHASFKNSIITYNNAINIDDNISELKREILDYLPHANAAIDREIERLYKIHSR